MPLPTEILELLKPGSQVGYALPTFSGPCPVGDVTGLMRE
jgi:hypothetical protein